VASGAKLYAVLSVQPGIRATQPVLTVASESWLSALASAHPSTEKVHVPLSVFADSA
jgi:hypothetical protein